MCICLRGTTKLAAATAAVVVHEGTSCILSIYIFHLYGCFRFCLFHWNWLENLIFLAFIGFSVCYYSFIFCFFINVSRLQWIKSDWWIKTIVIFRSMKLYKQKSKKKKKKKKENTFDLMDRIRIVWLFVEKSFWHTRFHQMKFGSAQPIWSLFCAFDEKKANITHTKNK